VLLSGSSTAHVLAHVNLAAVCVVGRAEIRTNARLAGYRRRLRSRCTVWLYAANIKVPTNIASGYGGTIAGLDEMRMGFRRQATWNSYAAIMTAVAAGLQAASHLI
jgi:ribonucleotide monophosphatase NagD (HAD superfamily)